MSGLYIHIPFCKQACHYCDFHFSTNRQRQTELVRAIAKEIALRKDYLSSPVQTIYFGGGTPSLLSQAELTLLFETIYRTFPVSSQAEITLEANPDDLQPGKIQLLRTFSINRFSVGIQSFYEPHLAYLNRAHSAAESMRCVQVAQDAGFDNLSIDLIYAIPHPDHSVWEKDLETAFQLNVPHISAYCLTIEQRTVFGKQLAKGQLQPVDEEFSIQQSQMLLAQVESSGFEQYEISNFAKSGKYARHNTHYWQRKPYLGVGPSAHSYNGKSRQYNVANNALYTKALQNNQIPATVEQLSLPDQVNEAIMMGLRTKWGCNLTEIRQWSGIDIMQHNRAQIENYQQRELMVVENDVLLLTAQGKLLADQIASDLFIVEDESVRC